MQFRIIDAIVAGVIYFKTVKELSSGSRRKEVSGVRALIAIGLVKKTWGCIS